MATIPPLASICSYNEAARVGYSVERSVELLRRFAWVEKRIMDAALAWLNPIPEWAVKEALSLHVYLDAEHVKLLRDRVKEMRNPPPPMDVSPDDDLERFLSEIVWGQTTLERLAAIYHVVRPALRDAYQSYLAQSNPVADYPTCRILRILIAEQDGAIQWGQQAIEALGGTASAADWIGHLKQYLASAGGIMGDQVRAENVPASRSGGKEFIPDFFPQREAQITGRWNFVFPPHEVARTENATVKEKTLALMAKRNLELDVVEAMARMIVEAEKQPWEYYVDMTRQLWDEARHSMLGEIYFEQLGVDWRSEIPLHPGFAIRLNQHMSATEAHAVLYTIEQSLMPAKTGKRYEWETAGQAGDALAQYFQDIDWADEVLHAQIGRRWLVPGMEREQVVELGRKKAIESETALVQYADRGEQVNWWPAFVQKVLGIESVITNQGGSVTDPVYSRGGESS